MDFTYNEKDLENTIIQMLIELNYKYSPTDTWVNNRNLNEFIIVDDLLESLEVINPQVKRNLFSEVQKKIENLEEISFIDKNKQFHTYLIDGIKIEDSVSRVNPIVKIIDFDNPDNNIFKVVNQVKFNEGRTTRIPDITIYVNGLPLVVFELKSIDSREDTTIEEAFLQIGGSSSNNGYRYDIPTLFHYNAFNVISDGINNKIGTITSDFERYSEWKSVDGIDVTKVNSTNKLDVLINGVFKKERLLDLISKCIFFIDKDKENLQKIITQYHQYFGVKKASESILKTIKPNGDGRAGIIWHTQGSGKSFSMVMLAHRLIKMKELDNPTIIILTDRNDLDDQLYSTFSNARNYLRTTPSKIGSRKELVDTISNVKESGIYFSTIQKIDKDNIVPNMRSNIIIMSDEAHRSHYGLEQKIEYNKVGTDYEMVSKFGYEKYIREAFPNATFLGFTGTPIQTKDKDTTVVFGDIIDVYDMTQSIEDGSTVKIYYESRLAKVWLDESKLSEIDAYYNELSQSGVSDEALKQSKSQMSKLEVLVGDKDRLNLLATDIVTHYNSRKGTLNDKAMIVCMNRKIAYNLYTIMLEKYPYLEEKLQLIITSSNKDTAEMRDSLKDKSHRDFIAADFKSKVGKTKIVIVVDMWLTGFDVPDLDVMYIDKRMKEHNLMQAIARVNRVFAGKQAGLIVDYIGLSKEIDSALSTFTKRDKDLNLKDIEETAKTIIEEKLSVLDEWFYKIKNDDFSNLTELEKFRLIQLGSDFILQNENRKKDYLKITIILKTAYIVALGCLSQIEKSKILYYLAVRQFIMKLEQSYNPISLTKINEKVSELLLDAIKGDEVKVLTKINEEDGSSIWDLLKPEKIQELRESNPPHIFIKLIEKLLAEAIKEYRGLNLVKSQQYSEKLRRILEKYYQRDELGGENIDSTIIGLIAFSQEMLEDENKAVKNELKGRERAFYDALTCNENVINLMNDETLKLIAVKLKDVVEKYATVDWMKKKSTRAEMRVQLKDLLFQYGYPPDYDEEAVENIVKQAEYMM